jgi:hypothetical protein
MAEYKIRPREDFHQDWHRYKDRYLMGEDFIRGGFEVKHPRIFSEEHTFRTTKQNPEDGSIEYDKGFMSVKSYLFPHEREEPGAFEGRNKRLRHFPVVKPVFEIIYDGLSKNPVKRNGTVNYKELGTFWHDFLCDCDGRGTDLDVFKRDIITHAMGTGKSGVLVHLDGQNTNPVSEYHRQTEQILPYLQFFSAYNTVYWETDRHGNFTYVELVEAAGRGRERRKIVTDVRVDTYEISTESDEVFHIEEESYTHNLGACPFVQFQLNRYADPYAPDLLDIDRGILNDCSLLSEIDRRQTFSILAFPSRSGLPEGLKIGLHDALSFDADSGSPFYLSPDAEIAAGLWRRIKEQFQLSRTVGSVSRGMAEVSKEARSGSAMQFESDEKYNKMIVLAQAVKRFENQLFGVIAMGSNQPPVETEISEEFDVLALDSKIATALSLVESSINDEALVPAVKAIMQDFQKRIGVKNEEIAKSLKALDDSLKNEVPEVLSGDEEQGPNQGQEQEDEVPGLRKDERRL